MPPAGSIATGSDRCIGGTLFPPTPDVGQHDRFHSNDLDLVVDNPSIGRFDSIIEGLVFPRVEESRSDDLFRDEVLVLQHVFTLPNTAFEFRYISQQVELSNSECSDRLPLSGEADGC